MESIPPRGIMRQKMTEEERVQEIEKALDEFKREMAAARKEFEAKTEEILERIRTRKLEEIKQSLHQ